LSPHQKSPRLASWQIRWLVWTGVLLWVSGVAWLGLHFFGRVEGEFGLEINPFEHWMLRLHGFLIIPAYVLLGGLLITHIPLGWRDRKQRPAGIGLLGLVILLSVSGYALYYVGTIGLREFSSWFHWIIGVASPLVFYWHYRRRYAMQAIRRASARQAESHSGK
jgi:hypothetical protein